MDTLQTPSTTTESWAQRQQGSDQEAVLALRHPNHFGASGI